MPITIHALTFGRLTMDSSGLVLFRRPGTRATIPFIGYLILGAGDPILVDTGASDKIDWAGWGMAFEKTPDMTVAAQLARFPLTLCSARPYRFRLHYHGSRMPFRGPVCYAFAGYNETCRDPPIRWLTPATVIELWAPGGVPRDLLTGYTMLVRFPALSERQYHFVPEAAPARDGGR